MNRATKIIVSTFGALIGISAINHGFFETLQGNIPTTGLIIQAIGDAQQMWLFGTEEAFTIVPNFLITGILAMIVGLAVTIWSVRFIHRKDGPLVFVILCILSFLVGGGVAQILLFTLAWAFATRIHAPLTWWRKILPETIRHELAKLWSIALVIASVSFLIGLEIAIFGYVPGVSKDNPELILKICWSFVFGGGLVMFLVAFVAGFAYDIQAKE
jgi:hypothetical protein